MFERNLPDSTILGRRAFMASIVGAGPDEIHLDLILDYRGNVALYPAFQRYFRDHRPALLAVWGKADPFFIHPGRRHIA